MTMVNVFLTNSYVITLMTVEITVMKMDVVCHVHCQFVNERKCEDVSEWPAILTIGNISKGSEESLFMVDLPFTEYLVML